MEPEGPYMELDDFDGHSDQEALHQHGEQPSYSRDFKPSEQTWRLLKEQALRFAFTVVIVVLIIATLKIYESGGNVEHDDKFAFNAIITVLNLALGLNFLEAFKDMAKVLRWRVLASRKFTVREADLILGGESLMKLMTLMWELMWESSKKPLTLFVCAIWLAQASIAMVSLNYSMDSGTDSNGITTSKGMVNATKLDCYYDNGICSTAPETAQSQAHAFGEITRAQRSCPYSSDDDIKSGPQNCSHFYSRDSLEFAVRYLDYNPRDSSHSHPFLTKRIVKAFPGECYRYDVGPIDTANGPDGIQEIWVVHFNNETYNGSLPVPKPSAAFDSTTYVYNGSLKPQEAIAQVCGPRCLWIYAFQSYSPITGRPNTMFQCPINVTDVSNVNNSAHVLPNDNARLAAASIALSGRYTNPNGPEKEWQQYQLYPHGSYWETQGLSPQLVGARMAEFAIGSLAAMANLNPQILIPGTLPTLGYHLSVQWNYVIALAACIVTAHCALVALMLWIARPIVVGSDSNLVTARLLHDLVGHLGGRGVLLDEKETAKAIMREGTGTEEVAFGIAQTDVGRVLQLGEHVEVGEKFPQGAYA